MHLFREISPLSATLLVVGNIVGVGIFTTSGLVADEVGESFWLLGVWGIGGLLSLAGAICYAALARRNPRAGGEYALLYPAFGPLPAFYSGWASLLIGFSAPMAAASIGFAAYMQPLLPFSTGPDAITLKALSIAVLLLVTGCVSVGLGAGTRLHNVLTLLNLALLMGFSLLVLRVTSPSSNLQSVLHSGSQDSPVSLAALGSSVVLIMFAYSGWNAAAYVAEEIRRPGLNIPLSLLCGTLMVTLAYLLVNLAFFSASSVAELRGEIAVAEIAARSALGGWGSGLVSLLIALSIFSSITAMSIAGPRVYFAMSRNGFLPEMLSHVDSRRKIPSRAIWFQTGVALFLVLVARFQQILMSSGVVMVFFTTLTVATAFTISLPHRSLGRVLVYRILPAIFVAVNLAILVSAAYTHWRECLAGLVAVLGGTPVYLYYSRRKG